MCKVDLQAILARSSWLLGLPSPDAHDTGGAEMAVSNSYLFLFAQNIGRLIQSVHECFFPSVHSSLHGLIFPFWWTMSQAPLRGNQRGIRVQWMRGARTQVLSPAPFPCWPLIAGKWLNQVLWWRLWTNSTGAADNVIIVDLYIHWENFQQVVVKCL